MNEKTVRMNVELEEDIALALAQLTKRIGWDDLRRNAYDDNEADKMLDGLGKIRNALENLGYAPR